MRKWLVLAAGLGVLACNPDDAVHHVGWFSTMRHEPKIRPYVMPRPSVPGTVPITGAEVQMIGLDPGGKTTTADRLVSPRARTAESLDRGKWVYETYCLVCHGETGHGDGPISAAAGGPFVGVRSLVTDTMARRSDGYIYGVIIHAPSMGRGLMPIYGNKVLGTDRWDVVNYVRSLQQQALGGGRP